MINEMHASNSYTYIMKMTQLFNDLNLILDTETLSVADIVQMYLELCNSLEDLKNLINLQNEDLSRIKKCYLNLKNNRKANDPLSDEEKKQMKIDLGVANSTVTKMLASSS